MIYYRSCEKKKSIRSHLGALATRVIIQKYMIYMIIGVYMRIVILSAYFYVKKGEDQKYWIICFIAIGIVLGTIVFRQLLLSEIIY